MNYWEYSGGGAYLSHHGILGQHWGQRNGPPYPLERTFGSPAKAKAFVRSGTEKTKAKVGKITSSETAQKVKKALTPRQKQNLKIKRKKQRNEKLAKYAVVAGSQVAAKWTTRAALAVPAGIAAGAVISATGAVPLGVIAGGAIIYAGGKGAQIAAKKASTKIVNKCGKTKIKDIDLIRAERKTAKKIKQTTKEYDKYRKYQFKAKDKIARMKSKNPERYAKKIRKSEIEMYKHRTKADKLYQKNRDLKKKYRVIVKKQK